MCVCVGGRGGKGMEAVSGRRDGAKVVGWKANSGERKTRWCENGGRERIEVVSGRQGGGSRLDIWEKDAGRNTGRKVTRGRKTSEQEANGWEGDRPHKLATQQEKFILS